MMLNGEGPHVEIAQYIPACLAKHTVGGWGGSGGHSSGWGCRPVGGGWDGGAMTDTGVATH